MTYFVLTMYGIFALLGAYITYIFINQKKYWYIPYGLSMVAVFVAWGYDHLYDTNFGDYALILILSLSVIESLVVLVSTLKLKRQEKENTEESVQTEQVQTLKPVPVMIWLVLKIALIYLIASGM